MDLDVLPGDGDVLVPVRSVHLVGEAKHVQQLVNHDLITDMKLEPDKRQDKRRHLERDAVARVEADQLPAGPEDVGQLGEAAVAAGDDVDVVVLRGAGQEPWSRCVTYPRAMLSAVPSVHLMQVFSSMCAMAEAITALWLSENPASIV